MPKSRYEHEVPIELLKETLPGLRMRFLIDRDAGVLHWENYQLDETGKVVDRSVLRLGLAHLVYLERVVELLFEARDRFTPRRRLDLARFDPPESAG